MEVLLAYALLFCEGYDYWNSYSEQLDKLFLESPDNDDYLYLEELNNPKEAALYIISSISESSINTDVFGPALMKLVGQAYIKSDLADFGRRMYSLWKNLPVAINNVEPFFTFCYADDCLSYGDEEQCRKLYEKAIHYYDRETNSNLFTNKLKSTQEKQYE